jgi:hypothetical protein
VNAIDHQKATSTIGEIADQIFLPPVTPLPAAPQNAAPQKARAAGHSKLNSGGKTNTTIQAHAAYTGR